MEEEEKECQSAHMLRVEPVGCLVGESGLWIQIHHLILSSKKRNRNRTASLVILIDQTASAQ